MRKAIDVALFVHNARIGRRDVPHPLGMHAQGDAPQVVVVELCNGILNQLREKQRQMEMSKPTPMGRF